MSEKNLETRENNKLVVCGRIEEEFEYSHEVLCEKFYKTKVIITRRSGTEDIIPIVVSEFLITSFLKENAKGKYVEVRGSFSSYNKYDEDGRMHLVLFIFATAINVCENEGIDEKSANMVYLDGYICKFPHFRKTLSAKKITDLLIKVKSTHYKTDYIPCIAWGSLARYARELQIHDKVKLFGRIQSRPYIKKDYELGTEEQMVAYEISIMKSRSLMMSRKKREA